eukprot:scaffold503_cov375-Pinguiococcus_pyrenoidosus.AAC.28
MGVPVTAHRLSAWRAVQPFAVVVEGFLMKCASSRMTRRHATLNRPLGATRTRLSDLSDLLLVPKNDAEALDSAPTTGLVRLYSLATIP